VQRLHELSRAFQCLRHQSVTRESSLRAYFGKLESKDRKSSRASAHVRVIVSESASGAGPCMGGEHVLRCLAGRHQAVEVSGNGAGRAPAGKPRIESLTALNWPIFSGLCHDIRHQSFSRKSRLRARTGTSLGLRTDYLYVDQRLLRGRISRCTLFHGCFSCCSIVSARCLST
jgi:hypothetical protein